MNSTLLKLLGFLLSLMIPFAVADTKQIEFIPFEFEKIVYKDSINDGVDSFFSFYDGMEYVEKTETFMIDRNINCLVDYEKETSNTVVAEPEFEKVVYKRLIGDSNNKAFFDINLEYYRMKGDSTVAKNLNCQLNYMIYQNNMSPSVPAETPEDYVQIAIQNFEEIRKDSPDVRSGYSQYTKGEITWSDDKLITMELITSLYTGGAHPHSSHYFLNVDPKTGKRINILHFITDMDTLRTTVQEKLIQALPDGQKQLWDQVPLPKHIGLTEDGLKLVYNEYEILAYAFGRTEILIPMDELRVFSVF